MMQMQSPNAQRYLSNTPQRTSSACQLFRYECNNQYNLHMKSGLVLGTAVSGDDRHLQDALSIRGPLPQVLAPRTFGRSRAPELPCTTATPVKLLLLLSFSHALS